MACAATGPASSRPKAQAASHRRAGEKRKEGGARVRAGKRDRTWTMVAHGQALARDAPRHVNPEAARGFQGASLLPLQAAGASSLQIQHTLLKMQQSFDPAGFAQRQLDAYNARDLARFVQEYTDDVVVYRMPAAEPVLQGKAALAAHYAANRFNLPGLYAELVNRMVFGNKVIDHERVFGVSPLPSEVAAIYEVTPAGIAKVWFVNEA